MTAQQAHLEHEVKMLPPEEAGVLLKLARNKAPLDKRQIAAYARDMQSGSWKLNGEPIIIDQSGQLLSGRLRLAAAIEAQAAFPTLIVRGVDAAHFDTIDALRRRTVSDVMTIRKEHDGRALASALSVLWRMSNDDFSSSSKRMSAPALVAILEANPDIRDSLKVSRNAAPALPHGLGAALHFLFSRVNPSAADVMFQALSSKERVDNAALASLKKQLEDGANFGGRRNQVQLAGLAIKAWEAFVSDKPVAFVRYSPDYDQFPRIPWLSEGARLDGVRASSSLASPSEAAANLPGLKVWTEVVSPDRARQILDRNDTNRAIAGAVVEKYARDMRAGSWALNGQTIKIGATGRLLDGQHRCAAAIRSNVSFPAVIVEGLDEAVFDTFDAGGRRTISTLLRDRGETNTAVLAAILRQVWLLETGLISLRTAAPTVSELMSVLDHHPGVRESAKLSSKVRDLTSSVALALHYFFARASESKANDFIDRLADGVMLEADNPVRRLREALLADRANRKRRLSDSEKAALIIKAWNAHLSDRPLKTLKWQNAGEKREAFPNILGVPELGRAV